MRKGSIFKYFFQEWFKFDTMNSVRQKKTSLCERIVSRLLLRPRAIRLSVEVLLARAALHKESGYPITKSN